MRLRTRSCAIIAIIWISLAFAGELPAPSGAYVATGTMNSSYATQAAAADDKYVYAISSTTVAKYDRATGKELAKSRGAAQHLNSGFLWNGKLYCVHSNYPQMPHESDLRVLDPESMELIVFHRFENPPGSLTWAVRRGEYWWCHFAHYGADNARAVLVKYDDRWKELARWRYPKDLVADWDGASLSGGIWQGEEILGIGHDKTVLYRLRVPARGDEIELVGVLQSPFPGQGIATDPKTGGLVGISRPKRQVIFAERASK